MTKFYPQIELQHVQNVSAATRLLASDPEWADEAPYGTQVLDLIRELAGQATEREEETGEIDLAEQTRKLYRDLIDTPRGKGSEAMAYFRTASTVLNRLIDLTAKAEEVKEYKAFKERVFAMFEHVLNADQVTDAMEFLKGTRMELPAPTEETT